MMDFLTFKTFISTDALIVFYYIGALVLPVGLWILLFWLLRKFKLMNAVFEQGKSMIWETLTGQQKIRLMTLFVVCFLFMELFWRMLFEFLIAYMQIRDALLQ